MKRNMMLTYVCALLAPLVFAQSNGLLIADGPFQPTDESLVQYECPEWFRDAKLGIWSHWGPVAAPGGFGGKGRGIPRAADYTAEDIRFTRSKDGATLYAIALGWPSSGKLEVRSLAKAAGPIGAVTLLGHSGLLAWTQGEDGLVATLPAQKPFETAFVLKITGVDLKPAPILPHDRPT